MLARNPAPCLRLLGGAHGRHEAHPPHPAKSARTATSSTESNKANPELIFPQEARRFSPLGCWPRATRCFLNRQVLSGKFVGGWRRRRVPGAPFVVSGALAGDDYPGSTSGAEATGDGIAHDGAEGGEALRHLGGFPIRADGFPRPDALTFVSSFDEMPADEIHLPRRE
jgi:hypothetical protein